jgi:hypothetical protein
MLISTKDAQRSDPPNPRVRDGKGPPNGRGASFRGRKAAPKRVRNPWTARPGTVSDTKKGKIPYFQPPACAMSRTPQQKQCRDTPKKTE